MRFQCLTKESPIKNVMCLKLVFVEGEKKPVPVAPNYLFIAILSAKMSSMKRV